MSELLHCSQLSLKNNQILICQSFNLTVKTGELWVILGRNGIGKSTLLQNLAGLKTASQSSLFLLQRAFAEYSLREIAQQMAVAFQENLFNPEANVYEAIIESRFPFLSLFKRRDKTEDVLVNKIISDFYLTPFIKRKISTLSGGERQRLALAQVFAQTPRILLFDEPTNHLDIHYQWFFLRYLQNYIKQNQAAAILVLQDFNLAYQFATHAIFLLGQGQILTGTRDEMFRQIVLEKLYDQALQEFKNEERTVWAAI